MPKLVNEQQSSVTSRRQDIDNVVIVQELIHSMKMKTGKTRWMAVKIGP